MILVRSPGRGRGAGGQNSLWRGEGRTERNMRLDESEWKSTRRRTGLGTGDTHLLISPAVAGATSVSANLNGVVEGGSVNVKEKRL